VPQNQHCHFFTGMDPGLNKFTPLSEAEVLKWDFISRSLYSASSSNPRRRIESPLREGLDDVVREVNGCITSHITVMFIMEDSLAWLLTEA
jgi:Chondroitin N-acetylgalactosaminyltransferase.